MGAVVSAVVCCGGCAAGRSWVGCAACDSAGFWGVISRGCVCSAGCCCGGFAAGALLGLAVPLAIRLGALILLHFYGAGFTAFTSSIIGRRSSSAISGMEARASALGAGLVNCGQSEAGTEEAAEDLGQGVVLLCHLAADEKGCARAGRK